MIYEVICEHGFGWYPERQSCQELLGYIPDLPSDLYCGFSGSSFVSNHLMYRGEDERSARQMCERLSSVASIRKILLLRDGQQTAHFERDKICNEWKRISVEQK